MISNTVMANGESLFKGELVFSGSLTKLTELVNELQEKGLEDLISKGGITLMIQGVPVTFGYTKDEIDLKFLRSKFKQIQNIMETV